LRLPGLRDDGKAHAKLALVDFPGGSEAEAKKEIELNPSYRPASPEPKNSRRCWIVWLKR